LFQYSGAGAVYRAVNNQDVITLSLSNIFSVV